MKQPHRKRGAREGAFTLMELMAVVAILFVVMGMVIGTSSYAKRKTWESQARAQIQAITTALEAYKSDNGGYPPLDTAAFNGDASSVEGYVSTSFPNGTRAYAIASVAANIPVDGWANSQFIYRALAGGSKKYMQFKPSQVVTVGSSGTLLPSGGATVVVDPWGFPYGYNPTQPKGNGQSFDLWSSGANMVSANNAYPLNGTVLDDLLNW